MRLRNLSIRHTVLLAIAAAVLLPALLLGYAERRLTREVHEPLLAQSRQALLVMTAAALVEPLWTIDERAIEAAARRVMQEPSVIGLTLTEQRPNIEPLVLQRGGTTQGIRLTTPIAREGERLGDLELRFDPQQIEQVVAERGRATMMLTALQVLIGAAVLGAVLYRRLLKPIARLKSQASAIASRADVPPVDWRRRDELGELGQHLNDVHEQIDNLFDRLETQKAELEKIALHDALTGLANRTLFRELTQSAVAAAQRSGAKLALLFVDLDRFKVINDTLGHAAGDALLAEIAARLRATVRSADVVCRHSGDEFTLLLRDPRHWDEVAATADRLLKAIEAPIRLVGQDCTVSASIGIASFPDDAADPDTLLRCADTAMYAAKRLGRARYSFFRTEFNDQLLATQQLEQELQQAISSEQFVLFYQPQVSARSGAIVGCEALIRWQHPSRGLVGPNDFISIAEHSGLIGDLGAWALRSACAQIADWKARGCLHGAVAVNVSALEFRHHRLIDTLTRSMAEFGVLPHELELELTESVLMTDSETTQRIVEQLHALGIRLAVDDFGTGYSSLAYLRRLRPSKVKIDRSFVRHMDADDGDRVLVQAIVQLAHVLGVAVVAEGVETTAQRELLDEMGCDVLQGYLISRPQPAPEFERIAADLGSRPPVARDAGEEPAVLQALALADRGKPREAVSSRG